MGYKLKNKVGTWVIGEDFFDREVEISELMRLIDDDQNVLIVAPRRVGKTSLVKETFRRLEAQDRDYLLYVDVQHCSTPEDVIIALSLSAQPYKRLWGKVEEAFSAFWKQIKGDIESLKCEDLEIKLRAGIAGDWQTKGRSIMKKLAGVDRPITICLDELPIMVARLLKAGNQEEYTLKHKTADVFLSWMRQIMIEYQGRIRFIVCGSIGLEPILRRHRLSHTINQLRSFPVQSWDRPTAAACLRALANHSGVVLPEEAIDAFLNHLSCYIPHHVQMFFSHIQMDAVRRDLLPPTAADVARIYEQSMLSTRGHAELADYEERLLRVLEPASVPLALDLLTEAAVEDGLTKDAADVLTSAERLENPQIVLREVLDVLEHDGYLVWNEERQSWQFVSRLVKDWWKRRFSQTYISPKERR